MVGGRWCWAISVFYKAITTRQASTAFSAPTSFVSCSALSSLLNNPVPTRARRPFHPTHTRHQPHASCRQFASGQLPPTSARLIHHIHPTVPPEPELTKHCFLRQHHPRTGGLITNLQHLSANANTLLGQCLTSRCEWCVYLPLTAHRLEITILLDLDSEHSALGGKISNCVRWLARELDVEPTYHLAFLTSGALIYSFFVSFII